jgi:hypothetical protein
VALMNVLEAQQNYTVRRVIESIGIPYGSRARVAAVTASDLL